MFDVRCLNFAFALHFTRSTGTKSRLFCEDTNQPLRYCQAIGTAALTLKPLKLCDGTIVVIPVTRSA